MKVWKFSQEQLQKHQEWQEKRKRWSSAFEIIEEMTGIKPEAVNEGGMFSFRPPVGAKLPDYFTKPDAKGAVRPKKNHFMGRKLLLHWREANIPSIHPFDFICHMGLGEIIGSRWTFRTDTLNGELVLIEAKNWNPEDYGYEPVEI